MPLFIGLFSPVPLAIPAGLEPATHGVEIRYSNLAARLQVPVALVTVTLLSLLWGPAHLVMASKRKRRRSMDDLRDARRIFVTAAQLSAR